MGICAKPRRLRKVTRSLAVAAFRRSRCRARTRSAARAAGRRDGLPRTADGHPDLKGVWNYATEMPLQRPDELAGKTSLTPEEVAKYREQMAARRRDRQSGRPSRYSAEGSTTCWQKADWSKRTSLITDPPDGKIPQTTPQAEARRARADGSLRTRRRAGGLRARGPLHHRLEHRAAHHARQPEQLTSSCSSRATIS